MGLLIIGCLGALAACSSDEKDCLPGDTSCGGSAGAPPVGGVGGTNATGGTGGATGGTGGATGGTGGATGGTGGVTNTLGAALTISGNEVSSTEAAIGGNVFLVFSANNAATTARGTDTTKLCVVGSVGIVPGTPPDYAAAYGMEFGFGLNDAPAAGGGGVVADAGADGGGAPLEESQPWPPGSVTGFSFTSDGPVIPATLRFKVQPFGAPVDPPFCAAIVPSIASGTSSTRAFRFSEV
ncbi:MAG: hypothetical protein ABW217_02535, partial [Polyangiaceae bacterium]